jgi:serine/threonine protein kinase
MRAIFMIPTSEPPTVPNAEHYSKEFNDFIRLCLQKNPKRRPTPLWMLKNHPFITSLADDSNTIIADLVEECMDEIDDYREGMDEEDDESEYSDASSNTNTLRANSMQDFQGNTLVNNRNNKTMDLSNYDTGSQSTMVEHNNQDTMIESSFNPDANSSQAPVPSYMMNTPQVLAPKTSAPVVKFYQEEQTLVVDAQSSSNDLEDALDSIKASKDAELAALEGYYKEQRMAIQALLSARS